MSNALYTEQETMKFTLQMNLTTRALYVSLCCYGLQHFSAEKETLFLIVLIFGCKDGGPLLLPDTED